MEIKLYDSFLQIKDKYKEESIKTPGVYFLPILGGCVNNCIFCGNKKFYEEKIVYDENQILESSDIVLFGNDPLHNPFILETLQHFRELNTKLKIHLQTSLNFVDPLLLEKIVSCSIETFTVSIHGHTSVVHDEIIGVDGGFDSMLRNLKLLKSFGCKVYANALILPSNICFLPQIKNFFFENEIIGSFSIPYYKKTVIKNRLYFDFNKLESIQGIFPIIGLPKCVYPQYLSLIELLNAGYISYVTYMYWSVVRLSKRGEDCEKCSHFTTCDGFIFMQDVFGLRKLIKAYVNS